MLHWVIYYMVSIISRKKGNENYYYLIHNSGKKQHERYLGKIIPQNIDSIKIKLEDEIFKKENIPSLEKIHDNYSKHIIKADPKIIQSENHEFKIHHIYSTQRIEGSTMTFGQTKKLLEYNLSPKDTATEHIVEAEQMEKIFNDLLVTKLNISKKLIIDWHEKLFEKTDTNNAGSFRRDDIAPYGGKTEYVLWADMIPDMGVLLKWYSENKNKLNPVILSAIFHKRFEMIHPFIDGNGRIGRLIMLLILHKNKYPLMNILPKEKLTYIKKLEASQTQNNNMIFLKWFVSKYFRDHKKYL